MEGELFEYDVLSTKMPSTMQQDQPSRKLVNSLSNGQFSNGDGPDMPRKPWEDVRFDPVLKPKQYHIKGNEFCTQMNVRQALIRQRI